MFVKIAEMRGEVIDVGGECRWRKLLAGLNKGAGVGVNVPQQFPFALFKLVG